MNDKLQEQKEFLRKFFHKAFMATKYSHELLFKSKDNQDSKRSFEQLISSTTFLSEAHSIYTQIEFYLQQNIDEIGERDEFYNNILRFSVYNDEVLENIRTDHSHQWSDIEFRSYVESFRTVAHSLDFKNPDELVDSTLLEN